MFNTVTKNNKYSTHYKILYVYNIIENQQIFQNYTRKIFDFYFKLLTHNALFYLISLWFRVFKLDGIFRQLQILQKSIVLL